MPRTEITPQIRRDLQLLKLRNVLDPKRHYRKDDSKGFPKYFQTGKIVDGPTEFFSARLTKKERSKLWQMRSWPITRLKLTSNESSTKFRNLRLPEEKIFINESRESGSKWINRPSCVINYYMV